MRKILPELLPEKASGVGRQASVLIGIEVE
jgi:hypothetical protein